MDSGYCGTATGRWSSYCRGTFGYSLFSTRCLGRSRTYKASTSIARGRTRRARSGRCETGKCGSSYSGSGVSSGGSKTRREARNANGCRGEASGGGRSCSGTSRRRRSWSATCYCSRSTSNSGRYWTRSRDESCGRSNVSTSRSCRDEAADSVMFRAAGGKDYRSLPPAARKPDSRHLLPRSGVFGRTATVTASAVVTRRTVSAPAITCCLGGRTTRRASSACRGLEAPA